MSHREDSKQQKSLCGDLQCSGSSCDICEAIRVSVKEQARIQCPNGVPSCENERLCDNCAIKLYPKHEQSQQRGGGAVGSRSALDVVPLQDFEVEQSGPICENCQKPEGSNANCTICAFFQESAETTCNGGDKNPDVHVSIQFQEDVGPRPEDLCALTPEVVQALVDLQHRIFASKVLPRIPITSSIPDSLVGPWRGCEWSSGNCWLVVILQMFQTGSWHTSINVSNPLGNALWILIYELRTRWFVSGQNLQAFRILMAEIIGQPEKGTLFENGQMDPHEVLKMLENAGAFKYDFSLSSESFIEGIHATPVINLGLSLLSSTKLIDKLSALDIDIEFNQKSMFSCLPSTLVIKVSSSELMSGSTVDFPASSVFDLGPLTFQITSVMLFINGHYLTVFIRLMYDTETETIRTTYWLSDSMSKDLDCGHHVPSIVQIYQEHFDDLWRKHAISITCARIPQIVDIDGIPHELNGIDFEPLKPACESLPQCDNDQYMTFGQNGKILIKKCRTRLEFQGAFLPPQPAPSAHVVQGINQKLTFADISIRDGEWSIRRGSFVEKGTYNVSLNQYMYNNAVYSKEQLLLLLNILYQKYKSE